MTSFTAVLVAVLLLPLLFILWLTESPPDPHHPYASQWLELAAHR